MARKDWVYIGISSLLVEGVDSFLKSDGAKITKMKTRQQFVNTLILEFFANYREKTGINHLPQPKEEEKTPSLFDLGTKKIKK